MWVLDIRGQNPQNRERGFQSQKSHFPPPQKRVFRVKESPFSAIFPCSALGIFRLRAPVSGGAGNGAYLALKPPFPDFGDFDPCKGQMDSYCGCAKRVGADFWEGVVTKHFSVKQ